MVAVTTADVVYIAENFSQAGFYSHAKCLRNFWNTGRPEAYKYASAKCYEKSIDDFIFLTYFSK